MSAQRPHRLLVGSALVAALTALAAAQIASAKPGGDSSAAMITGSFADSCRDFTAHSSKDISNVVLRYIDGRVVKDESTTTPDYSLDGGPGGEIDFVSVKSGTTTETFTCRRTNRPPTALLEIRTPVDAQTWVDGIPDGCFHTFFSGLVCPGWEPRTVWRSSAEFPYEQLDGGVAGGLFWSCSRDLPISLTFDFRGTGSSEPDGDIASWSLDFGDGTSAGGSWTTDPPADVVHTYASWTCGDIDAYVTLTVTDAAGQSDSDTILMRSLDGDPD